MIFFKQNRFSIKAEKLEDYVCPKDGNVSYNLWRLGKMNVMVRTRDHGMMNQGDGHQQQVIDLDRGGTHIQRWI